MKVKNYKEFNDNAEITFSLGEEDFKVKIPIDNKTKEELISDARTAINNNLLKRQNETMQPIIYKEDNNFIKKQFIEIDLDSLEPVNLTFPLKQGDRYSHEITVIPNDSKFNYQTGIVHYSDGNYQIINNSFTFRIPPNVLEFEGEMELEIEFQLEDLIRKSNRIRFVVLESLNSTDEIEFEDLTPIQDLLKNLGQLIIDNENINLEIIDTQSKLEKLNEDIHHHETIRKKNENDRQTNEKNRKDSENKRSNNELIRKENEEKRLKAEDTRVKNENDRTTIFSKRMTSIDSLEKDLTKNESIRKKNETERIKNEGSRLSNELLRKDNENDRKKNESIRVSEEKKRLNNESQRIKNEIYRQENESDRLADEKQRIQHENTRRNEEKLRLENEKARISNEDNRIKNENLRLETFTKITKSLNDTEDYININEQKRMKNEDLRLSQSKKVQEWIDNPELLRGPKGEQGTGINIINILESEQDLPNISNSTQGDAYLIDGHLYVFSSENKYINVGRLQGPQGKPGNEIRSATIIIANYNSHENSKKGADIVVPKGEDAAKIINNAIKILDGIGGEIKLMEGTYILKSGIVVASDKIHLTGIPNATIFKQSNKFTNNPTIALVLVRNTAKISNLEIQNFSGNTDPLLVTAFYASDDSEINNCYVRSSTPGPGIGFISERHSKIINCLSDSNEAGFMCNGMSTVINNSSANSKEAGFALGSTFKGICINNILKNDIIWDDSSHTSIVQNNIIWESDD